MGMRVLVACEESQRVCTAFRERGHEAYSCDIQDCSGAHLEWHIKQDVIPLLDGMCGFKDQEGEHHFIEKWDLIIAHPPCTYLSNVCTKLHSIRCNDLSAINIRTVKRIFAMNFFMMFALAKCERIAIENPIGVMNTVYRKPDEIISPYMFAESVDDTDNYVTKATCLWLKGLPILKTNGLPKPDNKKLFGVNPNGKARNWEESIRSNRATIRSKTFPGIAKAMAEQWG